MSDLGAFIGRVVAALDPIGVPYRFVGSIASTLHGPPRSTQDVDIVVALGPADLPRLLAAFPADCFYLSAGAARDAVKRRGPFNVSTSQVGGRPT